MNAGSVLRVTITGTSAVASNRNGGTFTVIVPASQEQMLAILQQKGVEIRYTDRNSSSQAWWINLAPLALLAVLWFIMIRKMQARKKPPEAPSATNNTSWPQS